MLGRWQAVAQTAAIADPHPNEVKDECERPERRGGGKVLRGCKAARRTANESPPPKVTGWRPDEGREGGKLSVIILQFHQIPIK